MIIKTSKTTQDQQRAVLAQEPESQPASGRGAMRRVICWTRGQTVGARDAPGPSRAAIYLRPKTQPGLRRTLIGCDTVNTLIKSGLFCAMRGSQAAAR